MYVLRRQLLGDELHMQGTSIHMQKETAKAVSMRHQQRHIFLVTNTIVLFLHHSNFFYEYIPLPIKYQLFIYAQKFNCHCLGTTRRPTLCQFLLSFSLFFQ